MTNRQPSDTLVPLVTRLTLSGQLPFIEGDQRNVLQGCAGRRSVSTANAINPTETSQGL